MKTINIKLNDYSCLLKTMYALESLLFELDVITKRELKNHLIGNKRSGNAPETVSIGRMLEDNIFISSALIEVLIEKKIVSGYNYLKYFNSSIPISDESITKEKISYLSEKIESIFGLLCDKGEITQKEMKDYFAEKIKLGM